MPAVDEGNLLSPRFFAACVPGALRLWTAAGMSRGKLVLVLSRVCVNGYTTLVCLTGTEIKKLSLLTVTSSTAHVRRA